MSWSNEKEHSTPSAVAQLTQQTEEFKRPFVPPQVEAIGSLPKVATQFAGGFTA